MAVIVELLGGAGHDVSEPFPTGLVDYGASSCSKFQTLVTHLWGLSPLSLRGGRRRVSRTRAGGWSPPGSTPVPCGLTATARIRSRHPVTLARSFPSRAPPPAGVKEPPPPGRDTRHAHGGGGTSASLGPQPVDGPPAPAPGAASSSAPLRAP